MYTLPPPVPAIECLVKQEIQQLVQDRNKRCCVCHTVPNLDCGSSESFNRDSLVSFDNVGLEEVLDLLDKRGAL